MPNPNLDGWDWPYILYVGRKWLGYTDEQVWRLTPRQFHTQLKVHEDVTKQMYGGSSDAPKQDSNVSYIDKIPGW